MYISAWTGACFWGPALGPVLTSFAVQAEGWRWSLWEIVWLSAPIFVVFFISYPETSADTILQRRAQRLRKRTGLRCKTRGEIAQAEMKPIAVIWDAIIKPTEIMIKDPAVLFTNVYVSCSPYLSDMVVLTNPDLAHLWHLLYLLRGLSPRLSTNLQFQPRRDRPGLSCYRPFDCNSCVDIPPLSNILSYSRY